MSDKENKCECKHGMYENDCVVCYEDSTPPQESEEEHNCGKCTVCIIAKYTRIGYSQGYQKGKSDGAKETIIDILNILKSEIFKDRIKTDEFLAKYGLTRETLITNTK